MNTSRLSFKKFLFLGIALVVSSAQAAVLFSDNFDSYANGIADATYKTNYAGAAGAPTFVITNGGLSGSKSFQATGDGTLIRTNVQINLAAGPVTLDIFFQRGTAGQAASPQIGLMTNVTGALNSSESVGGRFNNLEALDVRSTVGGAQSSVGTAPGATLTTGNWYFLRGIITSNAAANSLTVVLQLFNSDSAGVVGTGIVTNTQTFNNASVYSAAARLYAAVRLSGSTGVTNMDNFSVSQATTSPTITLTGPLGAVNTIVGTASPTPTSFQISGINLTGAPGNLTVTPPSGFEVSRTNNSAYSTSVSVPYSSSTLASTNVYVRLAASTGVGTYSGNITVAGGGDSKTIATASSTVGAAPPTITLTGTLGAVNTTYGTASASPTSFQISGSDLTGAPGNLTVTPPSGYEVSRTNNSGYSTSLSVPYASSTLASTNVYVRLTANATVPGSPYSGSITVSGGGTNQTIATASSTVSKVTPTVTVTVGSYTNSGSPQGPNSFTTVPSGDAGTATWEYVGVSGTTYGPSATRPSAAGYYTAQVTALTADANFNSSSSSAAAFTIANVTALFTDNFTVSGSSLNIDFENTLGREGGTLFPLPYLTRYTGANAFKQQLGHATAFTGNTNALLLFGDAGVRIDYDFSTVGAPIEIKFSAVMNWFGLANTNSLTVGNRSDGYDPTNAAFAFQLRRDGTTSIYTNGVAAAGASGTNFGDNVLVEYKVVLTDTAGTGSPFGSGGSKAAYYQSGTLLGTATIGQLTAGQGYIGFLGGQGNVGIDNLQISSISPAVITLTGTLAAVNTTFGAASASPTSFQISGSSLTPVSGNLTVTPPAGYEISLSSGSGYSTNLSVAYGSGALASTNVYVRLAATTAVGGYYGNITVTGGGDARTIATSFSTVSKAASTVTYGGTVSFTYDGAAHTPGITSITGSSGVRTTNYVGAGYASVNAPTNAGSYYVSNTVAADASYNGVTNSQSFVINPASTALSLASDTNPALPGANVTFTATVSSGAGVPTGSVTFKDGVSTLGTSSLDGSAQATFSTTSLAHGNRAITAEYAGAGNFSGSTNSPALTQVINNPPVAHSKTYGVAQGEVITITVAVGAKSLATDADGDSLTVTSLGDTNAVDYGTANITGGGSSITYANTSGSAGSEALFSYIVSDGYGGFATNSITIRLAPATGANLVSATAGGGNAYLTYAGIPGTNYALDHATSITPPITWVQEELKAAGGDGSLRFTNLLSTWPTNDFYRTRYVP